MEARHRIAPNRPLELFPASRSTMPSWESLPGHTRRAVLGLVAQVLFEHARSQNPQPRSDDDEC